MQTLQTLMKKLREFFLICVICIIIVSIITLITDWPVAMMSVFSLLLFFIYFLPAIVAFDRKHNNTVPIVLVNIFTGWTGIGWLVALIWAFSDNTKLLQTKVAIEQAEKIATATRDTPEPANNNKLVNCEMCGRRISLQAKSCPGCGHPMVADTSPRS